VLVDLPVNALKDEPELKHKSPQVNKLREAAKRLHHPGGKSLSANKTISVRDMAS